jgi:superfamily II DNA or RNA helicase
MKIRVGSKVVHKNDKSLGHGVVGVIDTVAGTINVAVRWSAGKLSGTLVYFPAQDLELVENSFERMPSLDESRRFRLTLLGHWFETRHGLTGELSNQPFQMLPHQVIITNRVVSSAPDNRAWLIADDVGLGKTIEAGMIMEVLRKQRLGGRFRCLILTPAGLVDQWHDEMQSRFSRKFRRFESKLRNELEASDQLIGSIDTLRRKEQHDALKVVTPWDLVIVDEAHHLSTTPDTLIYQLMQNLRDWRKCRNLLFLTATPHSGNKEHFLNMLRLLREDLFPKGGKEYSPADIAQVMLRNRKSEVTDTKGQRIFHGIQHTKRIPFEPTSDEVDFYEKLREYLRNGYRTAQSLQKDRKGSAGTGVGFVMSTFAKLASSSRSAISRALENRLEQLRGDDELKVADEDVDARYVGEADERKVRTEAIEVDKKTRKKKSIIQGELAYLEGLVSLLRELDAKSTDSKLTAFLEHLTPLPADVKLLIFTEYRATQDVLVTELTRLFGADAVVSIHGSMARSERKVSVDKFNEHVPNPRFMVSTEAGGEGLNMQKSCHTVINYDLPWNPMALQQRIGRVYRYGQRHPVQVYNLAVTSSSEAFADQKVCEYLERKIAHVTEALSHVQDGEPEDIRGEVLGEVTSKMKLSDLYQLAIEDGKKAAETKIDAAAEQVKQILGDKDRLLGIFRGLKSFDLTDYETVAARVPPEQLEFFVRDYLGCEGHDVTTDSEALLSVRVGKTLVQIGDQLVQGHLDPYAVNHRLEEGVVRRATADKELARNTRDCRRLLFGDPLFEAMVKHVQYARFSPRTGAFELPEAECGWAAGTEGMWVLFDLRVVRQDGSQGETILRRRLGSYLATKGGEPTRHDELVRCIHRQTYATGQFDMSEGERGYQQAKTLANEDLADLLETVRREFGASPTTGVMAKPIDDVGVAWVRSV